MMAAEQVGVVMGPGQSWAVMAIVFGLVGSLVAVAILRDVARTESRRERMRAANRAFTEQVAADRRRNGMKPR